ncbi:MAG: methionyl aminopeptidase [Lentisphaeria bacterium]|nr:methionyl aminopeptidase [Lentisphaeria bacterium]NQZ67042.1 methionyl aminopeptidase [Lentisphaeria bacterium]
MNDILRNDPCWCGSGRKYKKCHMYADRDKGRRNRNILIKTDAQIAGIRKSGNLTCRILDKVSDMIGAGVTTNEINELVQSETVKNGAIAAPLNYLGFPKSTCTSINEVVCHGIPEDRALVDGDIVNVDVTCILDGFYGDASRMFIIGKVSSEAKRLVEVSRECLEIGIQQVKPGNTFGDIGYHIQQHAESHKFSVVRKFTGHGVGVEFHEPPEVQHVGQPGQGPVMHPGMVFTIEPMINAGTYDCKILSDNWTAVTTDNSLSAQWEHTLVVTETGVDILTR